MALLLFLLAVSGAQEVCAAEKDPFVLETLEVEALEETEDSTFDLEQSFEESFIREKIFSEKIEAESIPDVKAAVKALPNVTVRELGGFSNTIEIRGLSGDRIISIADGVRLSNQGLTHTGGGEINMVDIGTLDSIEVIKGSPSVIYDPGATGGILIVESKPIAAEDHLGLKTTFGYDVGRDQTREAFYLSGARDGFGAALSYHRSDAKNYAVRNKAKLQEVIDRTNEDGDGLTGKDRLTDLGFQNKSFSLHLNYLLNENQRFTFQHSDFESVDSTSVLPGSRKPTLIHLNFLSREADQLRYQINEFASLQDIHIAISKQTLFREATENSTFTLDSRSLNISSTLSILKTQFTLGGETVFDEGVTQVIADQDYSAAYLSAEHVHTNLTYLAGVRVNQWKAQASLPPGQDVDAANNRVTVLGQCNPDTRKCGSQKETAETYAGGLVYSLSDAINISLNYSKTHRYPSLFERFIDDGNFVGGIFDLKSEEADNIDAAWKYYDGLFSVSISIFYSDFKNFIDTKQRRRIIDLPGLQDCIQRGDCDPSNGEFDDREDAFFSTDFIYSNIKKAVNRGFEVSLKRLKEEDYETGLSFGLSDFEVRAVNDPAEERLFSKASSPLEFNFYYKHYFPDWMFKPWLQLKARYVTNTPSVEQEGGFSPFFVADFFGGFRIAHNDHANLIFNAGLRNLSNKIYHEAFSPLDGLKRTFFFNLSAELG